jgi:hypothetical protein
MTAEPSWAATPQRQLAEDVPGDQHGEDAGAARGVADPRREMTMAPLHSDAALSSCGR